MELKVKLLEEERNEIKKDFYDKMEGFMDQIRDLKVRLSQYETVSEEPVEEAKMAEGDKPTEETATSEGGIMNSIASFFLTDSQLQTP